MKAILSPLIVTATFALALAAGHAAPAPLKADEPIVVPDRKSVV